MKERGGDLSLLEIHLDRVRWNYLSLQETLAAGTGCAAMVKADAYGLGAVAVAPELSKAGCRHFYVATFEEGLAVREALDAQSPLLRKAGTGHAGGVSEEAQIYVLHGSYDASPEEFAEYNLIPAMNSLGDIGRWSSIAKTTGRRPPAILHLDTGMNSLGLPATEADRLINDAGMLKPLDVRIVMSHLACADEPEHPKNREQLELFRRRTKQLALPCLLSFANSAGTFLGTEYHFDQVRSGRAIFGLNPRPALQNPMRGTVTLKARILQVRDVGKGETVGYGASYRVTAPSKLATISAGYADGYLRSLTGSGTVYVGEQRCPVVGRVSMNAVVADVSAVTPLPHAGEWAEIIGRHQTVEEVAAQARMRPSEVLTSLDMKGARIYSGHGS
ncbi:MAG: alanine racemase [Pseudomonadota bacterium]